MNKSMKAPLLLYLFAAVWVATGTAVNGAPKKTCVEAVKDLRQIATNISAASKAYWAHRNSIEELKFGRARNAVGATGQAEDEFANALGRQSSVQVTARRFRSALAAAQKCMPPEELRNIENIVTTHVRKINFDHPAVVSETEAISGAERRRMAR